MICIQNVFANERQKITYFIVKAAAAPLQNNTSDTNEDQKGIVTDIIELLNDPTVYFDYKVRPKKRMLMEMKNSKTPWISYGSSTWIGPQSLSLSQTPLMKVKHYFMTNKETSYKGFEQLFGTTLILIRGYDYPGLDKYIDSGKFHTMVVNDHEAAIKALVYKRGIAIPDMGFRLRYNLKKLGYDSKNFEFTDISSIISPQDINLCFSLNFPQPARVEVERRLKELKRNGTLKKVVDMYIN